MDALLVLFIGGLVSYSAICGTVGAEPGAPLWLRWPVPIWNFIRHGSPPKPRPDYARIARLERELGLVDSHLPELSPFEQGMRGVLEARPMRRGPKVCLTKDCAGDTREIETWSGILVARIHECETP